MSTSSGIRCSWCEQHSSDPPHISHFSNPTPKQASQISDFDASIQRTDDYIKQRVAFGRKRNEMVPAVNLPPELLATIFEFACCPKESDITVAAQLRHRSSAQCAQRVAMETSQLWSNVKIAFNDANSEAQAAKWRYCISKSGQRPLSASVSLMEGCNEYDEDRNTAILDVLEAYAHRLQTLELFPPEEWKFASAMARIANRLPLLTCLSLRRGLDSLEVLENSNLFAHAPELREVRLIDCSFMTVSLPLAQLERVMVAASLSGLSNVEECLDGLRLCPRLRSYTTNISCHAFHVAPVLMPMTHTTLEVLEVKGHSNSMAGTGIHAFLEALTLPMLRSFSLYIQDEDPLVGIPSLLPFLSRSAGQLETLCLGDQMPLQEQFWGCLQVLPKLRKLVLNNRFTKTLLTQRTLDLMNPTRYEDAGLVMDQSGRDRDRARTDTNEEGTGQCLAPNLETFYYLGPIELPPHSLVEFLADRWRGPSSTCNLGHDVEIQPSIELETRTARERPPPRLNEPLGRLRSVAFMGQIYPNEPKIQFDGADTAVLQRLQQEGMNVVF
ncbi:hypothetical protein BJ912DRAFT_1141863 [Pholiota molesta]|nr:hypothetical protein BJ912DRAFT_1141863 [Pholiota molesta]